MTKDEAERYKIGKLPKHVWDQVVHEFWDKTGIDEDNATEALFKVDDCLKQKGLKYWLCYGTALGFYRDGNFIPWDDDIDIHTVASDYEAVFDEIQRLEKLETQEKIAEAILTDEGKTWLQNNRDLIAAEKAKL